MRAGRSPTTSARGSLTGLDDAPGDGLYRADDAGDGRAEREAARSFEGGEVVGRNARGAELGLGASELGLGVGEARLHVVHVGPADQPGLALRGGYDAPPPQRRDATRRGATGGERADELGGLHLHHGGSGGDAVARLRQHAAHADPHRRGDLRPAEPVESGHRGRLPHGEARWRQPRGPSGRA